MQQKCEKYLRETRDACFCGPLKDCKHIRENRKYLMNEWLMNTSLLNTNSKQGKIYKSFVENCPVIVKHFHKSSLFGHGVRENLSGRCLNSLIQKYPFFTETLSYFHRNSGSYIVTEFIDGIILKDALAFLSNEEFLQILMQIVIALEVAQDSFLFTHFDLHCENVILKKINTFKIIFDQYCCTFEGYQPCIIDYGMSCGKTKENKWGQTGLESKYIFSEIVPGYDIFTFLLYCLKHANDNIITCIKQILEKFFQYSNQDYLKHLKHVDKIIPKQFFEFLKSNFSFKINYKLQPSLFKPIPIKTTNSFIDYHYHKLQLSKVDFNEMIKYDTNLFNTDDLTRELVDLYYKLIYLKLHRKIPQYRLIYKKFENNCYTYWENKIIIDIKNRYKWKI